MEDNEPRSTRDKKGWLIPYLIALDGMFYKRWDYWTKVCITNRIPKEPIPFIEFTPFHAFTEQQVQKNLRTCLGHLQYLSNPLEAFVDWLLWGFGRGDRFPEISDKTDDYWYRTFNLGLFYLEPSDHFADLASEYLGKHNSLGFFSTPGSVVDMMVRMTFGEEPKHEHKRMSVCDPCAGTGNMLLYASNYSLNLYGVDISPLLVKIATINAYIYIPWLAKRTKNLTIFDEQNEIYEIELPSGVKIPECSTCTGKPQSFILDIETDHAATVSDAGLITVEAPRISTDLVNKNLKPSNIKCARCAKEEYE